MQKRSQRTKRSSARRTLAGGLWTIERPQECHEGIACTDGRHWPNWMRKAEECKPRCMDPTFVQSSLTSGADLARHQIMFLQTKTSSGKCRAQHQPAPVFPVLQRARHVHTSSYHQISILTLNFNTSFVGHLTNVATLEYFTLTVFFSVFIERCSRV